MTKEATMSERHQFVCEVAGAASLIAGVALFSIGAALIVAGVALIVAGNAPGRRS